MIADQRLKETVSYVLLHGKEAASKHLGLDTESITRYIRLARERGLTEDLDEGDIQKPNVLVLDIETTPLEVSAWRIGKTNINPTDILKDKHLLSYAVKWLFEPTIFSSILTPEEAIAGNDERIVREVWEFVDHADIIIAHNGVRFDMSVLNSFFILHGLNPPSPYQIIDTLLQFRKIAAFTSNKQGYLNQVLKLEEKMEHEGLTLWHKCVKGDKEALDTMLRYNEQDIIGLEDLYITVRPWIRSHPNMSLYSTGTNVERCHRCNSEKITWLTDKPYVTGLNRYSTYRCDECHGIGASRHSELTIQDRKCLTKGLPR